MNSKKEIGSTQSEETSQGEVFILDDEATASFVGFFDVLIQMDLEQKSKEKERKQANGNKSVNTNAR